MGMVHACFKGTDETLGLATPLYRFFHEQIQKVFLRTDFVWVHEAKTYNHGLFQNRQTGYKTEINHNRETCCSGFSTIVQQISAIEPPRCLAIKRCSTGSSSATTVVRDRPLAERLTASDVCRRATFLCFNSALLLFFVKEPVCGK